MDLFPLWNSLRIAFFASIVVFFTGIFFAYYVSKLPSVAKGIIDVVLTLPLVLPPTVVGYFLILVFGLRTPLGSFLAGHGIRFVMTWYGGIISSAAVSFPLMYRTARGAFQSFDKVYHEAGLALGARPTRLFWQVRLPMCKQGILAGVVLAFARALGEYGATSMLVGYTPGRTATISTTVYQLWRTNNEKEAFFWVMVNVLISTVVLVAVNILESRRKGTEKN